MKTGSERWCRAAGGRMLARTVALGGLLGATCTAGFAAVNVPPTFAGGQRQTIGMCGGTLLTLNSTLAINDPDAGQTETWSISSAPAHGGLTGFPVTATSTGGLVTPSWLQYVPATGFAGIDSFTITVTDGAATASTTILVTVNGTPVLTSPLTAATCDQAVFSYLPTTAPAATTIAWHRAYMPGIANATADGTGNPAETLLNLTSNDAATAYVFTLSANGCTSHTTVAVTVHATPRLAGAVNDSICSGSTYSYMPASPTAGTTISWSRDAVAGLEPSAPATGSGAIAEILTNTTAGPITAVYNFLLTANGCNAGRTMGITVLPPRAGTPITTMPDTALCSRVMYQNFGAGEAPGAGMYYRWSAVNATVWATGGNGQYSLVSFATPGDAVVTLTTGDGGRCPGQSTYTVHVGTGVAETGAVIYYNNQFVYQDYTQDGYQWGYDDAATLDSTIIPGATFQSYADSHPDLLHRYYWVMTAKNGCSQKTYFNEPLGVARYNEKIYFTIFPNPAGNTLHVQALTSEEMSITITDVTGRIWATQAARAGTATIDIAALPAGCYLVSGIKNTVRVATARFVKSGE